MTTTSIEAAAPARLTRVPATEAGALSLVALESQPAPAGLGGTYRRLHGAAVDDAGEVVFAASLIDSSARCAIVLQSAQGPRVVAHAGECAPGGGRYAAFGDVDVTRVRTPEGDEPLVLFGARLEGGPATEGLFLWRPRGVDAVALASGASPRGNVYASFDQLTIASTAPGSADYRLAFAATMADGTRAVVIRPSFQDALEMLAAGDRLDHDVALDFALSPMGTSLACVVELRRGPSRRFREAMIVHNGFVSSGSVLREGARFKSLGKVKRFVGRPAVNGQEGFFGVELGRGVTGLATRSVFGRSGVFARSGDPAPGGVARRIEAFGPPVANGGAGVPFGVVSRVTLDGGTPALWCGVFHQQVPLAGEARLRLVGDEASVGEDGPRLRSFIPLKLANDGRLLLRAEVAGATGDAGGLVLLRGLFDAAMGNALAASDA